MPKQLELYLCPCYTIIVKNLILQWAGGEPECFLISFHTKNLKPRDTVLIKEVICKKWLKRCRPIVHISAPFRVINNNLIGRAENSDSKNKQSTYCLTILRVTSRPTVVKRKLLNENRLGSKGKYQGNGESTARSLSQITFMKKKNYIH